MSKHRISRTNFWNVVLNSLPFAHLSGALHRAGHITGASAALRSKMVAEVVSGGREIPERPDGSHELLFRCLQIYRAKEKPPNAPSGNERLIVLKDRKAEAFWKALTGARGMASLVWNDRATAIDPTRPSTYRALPMPQRLDWSCDGVENPWRRLFPESRHRNALWRIALFPVVLRKALPSWWWTPAVESWLKRCCLHFPEFQADEVGRFAAVEPPPVPDPETLLKVVQDQRKRWYQNLHWVPPDSELDRGFRYTLQIEPRRLSVVVSTRRRVVGTWTEVVAHGMTSRFIEFSPSRDAESVELACNSGRRLKTVRFSPRLAVEELESPFAQVGDARVGAMPLGMCSQFTKAVPDQQYQLAIPL